VMAGAVKLLDLGGIGAENHNLGGLNPPNFAAPCPIEAILVAKVNRSPIKYKSSARVTRAGLTFRQICRPMSSRPS
jgi:hypothetical protein